MRDPWHEETLGQLVLLLRSRAPVRFAVVITSSEDLEEEVVESLKAEHGEAIWHSLELDGHGDLEAFKAWRRLEPDPRRVVLVRGLSRLVAEERNTKILGAFNYQREAIAERKEGLIFFVDEAAASALTSEAPDFYRFTLGFEFVQLGDLFRAAEAREASRKDKQPESIPFSYYQRNLDRARAEGRPNQIAGALLEIARSERWELRIDDAWRHIEEAAEIVDASDDPSLEILLAIERSQTCAALGRYDDSIRWAESAVTESKAEAASVHILASARLSLLLALDAQGRLREALQLVDRALSESRAVGSVWELTFALYRARILGNSGRLNEARDVLSTLSEKSMPTTLLGHYFSVQVDICFLHGTTLYQAARDAGRANAYLDETAPSARYLVILRNFGELRQAREFADQIEFSTIEDVRDRSLLARASLFLALDCLEVEQFQACPQVQNWRSLVREDLPPRIRFQADQISAEMYASAGRIREASVRAEKSRLLAEEVGHVYLSEVEHALARLYRLDGDLDRSTELAESASRRAHDQGARPIVARADTERAFVALARGAAEAARGLADGALSNITETRFRRDEPAALAARAEALRRLGEDHEPDEKRWRRLVRGMGARGLEQRIEQSLEAT